MEIDPRPIKPLPGQMELPIVQEQPPATRSRWNLKAWRDGRQAALDGKAYLDCPIPERRGYGHSVAAMRAHTHYIKVYQRYWRDGYQSVRLF